MTVSAVFFENVWGEMENNVRMARISVLWDAFMLSPIPAGALLVSFALIWAISVLLVGWKDVRWQEWKKYLAILVLAGLLSQSLLMFYQNMKVNQLLIYLKSKSDA